MEKVTTTEAAQALIRTLKDTHGKLVFMHSEGCCDGTSPICMPAEDFYCGDQDHLIGEVLEVPYYMHTSNLSYWEHFRIVIDVEEGMGNSFSLESTENKSFIVRSTRI
ncbi:DUF779 domain-containing protein [Bacillus sp. FJAT-45037]|uniref:DUF779 domain-containing protein n=1 Tax=Bacillus sp. FJAT-45037 TaxID=2011007 RepID=UPI000C23AE4F|nr:DUF779 domain-containing protein [Bacillus sp. FJAT-45037]